jgi:hypothetical protein
MNDSNNKYQLAACESLAIKRMLPALGKSVAESGVGGKAFNDFTKEEIVSFVANTIKIFRFELAESLEGEVPF